MQIEHLRQEFRAKSLYRPTLEGQMELAMDEDTFVETVLKLMERGKVPPVVRFKRGEMVYID